MDKKISGLDPVIQLATTDALPIVNLGTTRKVSIEQLQDFLTPNVTGVELLANKQNSLEVDETGTKYPTVDAVNIGLANVNTNAVDRVTVKLGSAINKGQAVYVSSAEGTNIVVSKASNLTEATSSKVIGLLETTGVLNDIVNVVKDGLLAGLNTSTALIGDPVFLGSNGELIYGLANKPFAPAHLVSIGIVTRVNINNGEILVKIQNGYELNEIHDVSAQTPSNKDVLSFDSVTGLWKNNTLSSILPAITITDTFVVASQTAMLAIVGETGDVAVRTDISKTFILKGTNPTVLADWQEILTPTGGAVSSVFNRTGNVVSVSGDYTADQITETATRKFQTANQNTFNDATSSIQTQLNGIAIKAIDEGNGIGYVIANRNPLRFGNVGLGAIDLSSSAFNSTINGATGKGSFAVGESQIASGEGSVVIGGANTADGYQAIAIGNSNIVKDYSVAIGNVNEVLGNQSVAIGTDLKTFSYAEIAIGGSNTSYIPISATYFEPLDRLIVIGNGNAINSEVSDALIILKNGLTTLPSVTNALIAAEPTGKAVVTKEYLESKYSQIQLIDNTDTASILNEGLLRYSSNATSSYVDIVMQTAPSIFEWVNIVANTDTPIDEGNTVPSVTYYSDYVTANSEISTTSLTDVTATGMTITPPAGVYKVDFSANYGIIAGNICDIATIDLQTLYLDLLTMTATATHGLTFGSGEILTAGIYTVAGAMSVAGTLTLDGGGNENSLFVIRATGAINTAISTSIVLANGANAANVFFVALGAVGIGADNEINGNFIAYGAAAALGANCIFTGRLFSTSGAIAFGAGILKRPTLTSVVNVGILENFLCFTSDGDVANTAIAVVTGDLGTNLGLVSVFANTVFNGSAYDNTQQLGITNVFSIYVGNQRVMNSDRTRRYSNYTEDITLTGIAVTDGTQAITIKWRTDLGRVLLNNRILTVKTF